jgi:hypothetical protein
MFPISSLRRFHCSARILELYHDHANRRVADVLDPVHEWLAVNRRTREELGFGRQAAGNVVTDPTAGDDMDDRGRV